MYIVVWFCILFIFCKVCWLILIFWGKNFINFNLVLCVVLFKIVYNCLGMIVFMDGGIVRFLMINLYVFFCDLCVVILKVGIIGNIVFFIWIGDFVVNKKFIVIVFIGIFFFRCESVVF